MAAIKNLLSPFSGSHFFIDEKEVLFYPFSYAEHKYPYDWRTKKPTIFRATEQWFASVEGFRLAAMDAIGHVKWIPPQVFVFSTLITLEML